VLTPRGLASALVPARCIRVFAVLMLALVFEMTVAEFVAIQRLDDRQRRRHFGLPQHCVPVVTAIRAIRGRVHVLVTCERRTDEQSAVWRRTRS
jgi:hypothetical protein